MQQTILQQERCSVRNQRITLHLSETNSTTSLPALNRLMRQHIHGACRTHLPLVRHHVTQSLIVHHTEEDIRSHLSTVDATVQLLGAIVIVSAILEQRSKVIDGRVLLREAKRCGIVDQTVNGSCFASHRFDHHGNGHPRWETVRIEHNVRYQTRLGEWQIDCRPLLRTDTFLAGTRGELIADRWVSRYSIGDASLARSLDVELSTEFDRIDVALLGAVELGEFVDRFVGVEVTEQLRKQHKLIT